MTPNAQNQATVATRKPDKALFKKCKLLLKTNTAATGRAEF
jgi:hypothetical protein